MNYFERLVRRALLQPSAEAGATVPNPFENMEDWPVETPAPAVRPRAESPPPATTGPLQPIIQGVIEPGHAAPSGQGAETVQMPSLSIAPPSAEIRPISAASTAPTDGRITAQGLDLADQFMHTMGIYPTATVTPALTEPSITVGPAPALKRAERAEAAQQPTQAIVPPLPPVPEIRHIREEAPGAEAATQSRGAAHEPQRETSRRAQTALETRRVVVVESRSAHDETGGICGAGSPYYGLGQL
jgi:hypothetical protein